jgi:hypothetical protein
MKNKKIVIAVFVTLTLLSAQMVFAADPNDFVNAVVAVDFSKAERILKNDSRKWSVTEQELAWRKLHERQINGNNRLRAAQLLHQYNISNKEEVFGVLSEKYDRYCIEIGMSARSALSGAFDDGYSDDYVLYSLDKGAVVGASLLKAAEKRRWSIFSAMLANSDDDAINYRHTREEYNQQENELKKRGFTIGPYDPANSKTALMFAAQAGQMRIVKALVERGAKVNLRADDGATAASLAYDNGEIEVYNYLKANGAVDFESKQAAQAAPVQSAPSTTNVYVAPSSPSPAPAQSRPAAPASPQYELSYKSINNVYRSSAGGAMHINGNSAIFFDSSNKQSYGTCSLSGTRLSFSFSSGPLQGKSLSYTVDSVDQFSGNGETFRR